MSNKFLLTVLSVSFIVTSLSFAKLDSLIIFEDNFDSFTADQQLVCQDSLKWDTWSSLPCDPTEDPFITNTNSYSGTNSVWIKQNNDLVKPIPDYTTGKYSISFYLYIPENYVASWGQLASFVRPNTTEWGFIAKFDPSGNGYVNGGGIGAPFPFTYDTWMHNELIVDLNKDSAEYYFEDNLIHRWQWTLGMWGDTCKCQLSVTDIMGGDWPLPHPSQWYIDDFILERRDTILGVNDFYLPAGFALDQNYPNPFNPKTKISWQSPVSNRQIFKVFDVLGNEVATLVDEYREAGSYEIEFNAEKLSTGIYFYQLQAGSFVQTRKMILLK